MKMTMKEMNICKDYPDVFGDSGRRLSWLPWLDMTSGIVDFYQDNILLMSYLTADNTFCVLHHCDVIISRDL